MPRDLPVGNGALQVNFDAQYQLRDLYWPHVGQENHTAGHACRCGVWVDGAFHWLHDSGWQRELHYQPQTMVTAVTLAHPQLRLTLLCQDVVDFHENLYLRKITVRNAAAEAREVRLFFTHDLHISGSSVGDTAYYEPERKALFHYKGKRWFMMNTARWAEDHWELGIDQWATGVKEALGREGTWRDAEDGVLSGNAVAQGSVDSVLALHLLAPAGGEVVGWYWIAVGDEFQEVTRINRAVRQKGPDVYFGRTSAYWRLWVTKEEEDLSVLPPSLRDHYQRSLLILPTQIDQEGAILAATDYETARLYNDTYAYMWPRDGALIAAALIDTGYSEAARRFFNFCHRVITPEGYLLHKYTPDGSLASSWHGWYHDGRKELPVQEDETALVLWALWRHFRRFRDVEFIKPLFRGLIVRAANWLRAYRDPATGLPLPSWNLWEEQRGVFPWTVGAVWGGLQAAAEFCAAFGEYALADAYRATAREIREATERQLWNEQAGCFSGRLAGPDDRLGPLEMQAESAQVGLWFFGMFPADDPRIVSSMRWIYDELWVKTPVGGLARYVGDLYQRVSPELPGNPWFISTLWLAQWHLARAKMPEDAAPALELLQWAVEHALPSGVMAEQVDPYTGVPLSVSPLTWSHATFILAIRQYLALHHAG